VSFLSEAVPIGGDSGFDPIAHPKKTPFAGVFFILTHTNIVSRFIDNENKMLKNLQDSGLKRIRWRSQDWDGYWAVDTLFLPSNIIKYH
jgi:hypothetical protein